MTIEREQTMQLTQRKAWIDVLRALALLFVMFGHIVSPGTAYYVFTSPIKIPLFFAISGYVFNDRKGNVGEFFVRLVKRLVIPWLVLTLALSVLLVPQGMKKVGEYVVEVLLGQRYWYMPCCIVAEIIFFFTLKFLKKQWQIVVFALSVAVIGLLLPRTAVSELFKFRTALVAQSFLLIGYAFKRNEGLIDRIKVGWLFGGVAAYVLLGMVSLWLFPGQTLDVNTGRYYNYPLCVAMILLGCFLSFALFRKINRFPKLLEKLGQNTLVFYLFHSNVVQAFVLVGISFPNAWWGGLFDFLLACAGCTVVAAVLNRFFPEVVGRKRVKKHAAKS